MIRVLVVDDQQLIRSGFRMIVDAEEDLEVVGEAGDGEEAIREVDRLKPDVVLMDIRMPIMDGVEATQHISKTATKVLILTTFDLDEYVFGAVRAGASGFLLKDAPAEDLINAIHVVARGDALIEPRLTKRLIKEFARGPKIDATHEKRLKTLTAREIEVLEQIAHGLTNSEIAEHFSISETTVKSHVGHILSKLHLRDRVQAVVLAYESGIASSERR